MTESFLDRITRTKHPRLTALLVLGVGLLGVALGIALSDSALGLDLDVLAFRVALVGFLSLVFGGAGYVSVAVFEHRPDR